MPNKLRRLINAVNQITGGSLKAQELRALSIEDILRSLIDDSDLEEVLTVLDWIADSDGVSLWAMLGEQKTNAAVQTETGTLVAYDPNAEIGVIEADSGGLIPFRKADFPGLEEQLKAREKEVPDDGEGAGTDDGGDAR